MFRKILFGLLWFVVIFVVCYMAGGVLFVRLTGGFDAYASSYEAGQTFRRAYMGYIALGALVLAIAGSAAGVLPGTKVRRKKS